jgi:hypothetical protein
MTSRDRYLKELTINKMSRQDKYESSKILTALQEYYDLNQKKKDGTLSSFQDKLKLAYLKVFFKNIVDGDDVSNFKKCSKTDYECFQEEYKRAKELIERETGKYNIIISKYLELVDKSIYNYSDNDDAKKFEKYIQYLSRKIKTLMNKTSLNRTRPDANKQEFLTDLFKPIPNTFRLSDVNDFGEDKVKPENFSRFTPDQIESISTENLKTLTEKQLSYINADGWDRLGKRVNDIDSAKLKKVNSKGMYKQLNPDNLTELFIYNPYKYIEEFDGYLLDKVGVDFEVPQGSSNGSSYLVGGATNPYRFTLNDEDLLLKFLRKITRKISYDHFNQIINRLDFGDKMFEIIIDKLDYKEIIETIKSNIESAAQNLMDLVSTNKISQQLILKFLENILKHYKTTSIDSVDTRLIMLIGQHINNIRKNARVGADGADNDTDDGADNDTAPPADNYTNGTNIEPLNTLDKFANSASILTAMQRTNESSNNKNVTKVLQKVGNIAKIGATAVGDLGLGTTAAIGATAATAVGAVSAAAKAIKSKMNNGTNGTDIEPSEFINTLDKIANSASILTAMQSRSGTQNDTTIHNNTRIGLLDNNQVAPAPDSTNEINTNNFMVDPMSINTGSGNTSTDRPRILPDIIDNLEDKANNASILTAMQSRSGISETTKSNQLNILNNARKNSSGIEHSVQVNNQTEGKFQKNRDAPNEDAATSFITRLEKIAEPLGIITGISRKSVNKRNQSDVFDRGLNSITVTNQENDTTDEQDIIETIGNIADGASILTAIQSTKEDRNNIGNNNNRVASATNEPNTNPAMSDLQKINQIEIDMKKNKAEIEQKEAEIEQKEAESKQIKAVIEQRNNNISKIEESITQYIQKNDEQQSKNKLPVTDYSKRNLANALRKELSEKQERIPPLSAQYHRTLYSSRKNVKPITPSVSPATRVVVPGGAPSKDNSRTLVSKEMKKNESTGTDFRDDLENWIDFYKEEKVKTEIEKFRNRVESFKTILTQFAINSTPKVSYNALAENDKTIKDSIALYQKELERVKKDIEGKLGELSTTNLKETIQKSLEINTNILNQSQFSQYFTDTKYDTFKENVKTYNRHLNKLLDKYEENNKKINENDIKNIITDLKNAINIITDLKKRNSVNENVEKAESLKARLNKNLESIITSESEFFKKEKDDIDKSNNAIKDQLDSVLTKLKKNARSTVSKAVDGSDISSKLTTESLFSRLWKNYLNDLNDENQIIEEAQDKLYRSYKSNNLDPEQALALSQDDKIIFVVIIFVIRQISLAITETMIDYDIIKNLYNALIAYVGFYALLIIIIITVVNIDDYKLRIVFNFFNMHINQPGIFGHIFILIGLFVLIYMLIKQMYKDIDTDKAKLTEIEKMRLVYRIELMSIFIFVVTSILVLAT